MTEVGKMLVVVGLVAVVIGGLLWSGFGKGRLGRLPGDINVTRGDFSFHFPVVTCLLVSVLVTLVLWLWRR